MTLRFAWCPIGLLMLAACGSPAPETTPAPAPSAPVTPPAPAPSNPPATTPPPKASAPHGPDDTPILIADGSMWIGLTPAPGSQGQGRERAFTFSSFDPNPGYGNNEVRSIMLRDNYDMRYVLDGVDLNGTAAPTCQNPQEDCLIQVQYEGPGMDLEVSWAPSEQYNGQRRLSMRFPGRPVNEWVDYVRDSRVILHPVDWDHAAGKKFGQIYFNRSAQALDPNGNRITIHLKAEPRR